MEKTVIVTIDEAGNPTIKVEGVKGPACAALTADLEKALGSVKSSQKTAEYAQTSATNTLKAGVK